MTARSFVHSAVILLLLASCVHAADRSFDIENTNFFLRQPDIFNTTDYVYDYNRLRLSSEGSAGNFFWTFTGDAVNFLGQSYVDSRDFQYLKAIKVDIPFDVRTTVYDYGCGAAFFKLHRLYSGYQDARQVLSIGVQKISMGVGRIWTPTDLYNPRNAYALEPDEVPGVLAADYTYSISDMSTLSTVISMRGDHTLKYAARFKGYLCVADLGVDFMISHDTLMIGYEFEGNLFDTGAEWRSEGGYFRNYPMNAGFFQGILGADYGFENGLTAAVEMLYSSQTFSSVQLLEDYDCEIINDMMMSPFYAGLTLQYDFNLAFSGSLLFIESFYGPDSSFIAPVVTYTLNDHHTFSLGAQFNVGHGNSEFGMLGNIYYLKWKAAF